MRSDSTKQSDSVEPMGIVISDGGHGNVTSRLAAFVWGPVPEDVLEELDADGASDTRAFALMT